MEDLFQFSIGVTLAAGNVRLLNHFGKDENGLLAATVVSLLDYDWHYNKLRKDHVWTLNMLHCGG